MALEIISVQDAKDYCRVTYDSDDWLFEILIAAAFEAVTTLADDWTPSDDIGDVPGRIKLAMLVHIGRAYDQRHDGADIPPSAAQLLSSLRKLSV